MLKDHLKQCPSITATVHISFALYFCSGTSRKQHPRQNPTHDNTSLPSNPFSSQAYIEESYPEHAKLTIL